MGNGSGTAADRRQEIGAHGLPPSHNGGHSAFESHVSFHAFSSGGAPMDDSGRERWHGGQGGGVAGVYGGGLAQLPSGFSPNQSTMAGSADTREVELCLHSVHNVQHSPSESYYGMAMVFGSEMEVPVTSERPARLTTGLDGLVVVRVFLHERGAPASGDRAIGHLSIPVREAVELCGPGIYQTWFLLEDPAIGIGGEREQRPRVAHRFRRALQGVPQELHAPRVCLTLRESSVDHSEWLRDEASRVTYFKSLLVSHGQHVEASRAYFQHLERVNNAEERRLQNRATAPIEASNLREQLERLQQRQRREELEQLQAELDHVTDEANRRIERGNETIIRLKDQLKELRDVEAVKLKDEVEQGKRRWQAAQQRNAELKARLEQQQESLADGAREEELARLRQDVLVLTKQKTALMGMVQEVYGSAKAPQKGVQQANAMPVADPDDGLGMSMLLPDPRALLGTGGFR